MMNAAVFVDFENLFASLRARGDLLGRRTRDLALTILENLKTRLAQDGLQLVMGRSYAAFDTYPGMEVAHDLALMGFDPQYVLVSPTGRNSADVQLTVDVCRVLFRRADIETIVIVAGDRDFIPIARQVLEENRGLRVVGIPDATCGDLRMRVGGERFLSALDLLPADATARASDPPAGEVEAVGFEPASADRPEGGGAAVGEPTTDESSTSRAGPDLNGGSASVAGDGRGARPNVGRPEQVRLAPPPASAASGALLDRRDASRAAIVRHIPVTWRRGDETEDGDREDQYAACLDLIVRAQVRHGSREIWLSPFLKGPMSQHFSHLVHTDRRALINELRGHGAIRVEERENQFADHPYSVIVLQEDHPWVQAAMARHG